MLRNSLNNNFCSTFKNIPASVCVNVVQRNNCCQLAPLPSHNVSKPYINQRIFQNCSEFIRNARLCQKNKHITMVPNFDHFCHYYIEQKRVMCFIIITLQMLFTRMLLVWRNFVKRTEFRHKVKSNTVYFAERYHPCWN